jgi:4-cresol dehydrogenase (hydroxylating)
MSRFVALPVGVTEETFAKAIKEYRALLGEERVRTDPTSLQSYTKIMYPESEEQHVPSAAMLPRTVEEIQAVVAIANKYKTPLWTVSTGKNFGYGSSAPATRGQIVLDLKTMNKIIHIDAELGYCLVEPGVTYYDLNKYFEKHKMNLMISVPSPSAIVGPVGNICDRGAGYTPYGDHFLFSCGMEVVLANGDVIRTGMGGIPDSSSWHAFKWGYGPYVDGLFTQSNYGIVTKMGVWLMKTPPPGGYKPFLMKFSKHEMLPEIIKTIMPLRLSQIIPNACVVVNPLLEAACYCNYERTGKLTSKETFYKGTGILPPKVIEEIRRELNIGAWSFYAALYGTPEQVALNWKYVTGAFKGKFGGDVVIVTEEEAGDDINFEFRRQMMKGGCSLQEFTYYNWRGGGGSTWFAPVAAARPSESMNQVELATKVLNEHGFDYLAEYIVGWREMHHIIDLLYDRNDPEELKRAYACYDELLSVFKKNGYGTYRTNPAFMEKTADTFGPEMRKIHRSLKQALDPNNILAPGKSGINLNA